MTERYMLRGRRLQQRQRQRRVNEITAKHLPVWARHRHVQYNVSFTPPPVPTKNNGNVSTLRYTSPARPAVVLRL